MNGRPPRASYCWLEIQKKFQHYHEVSYCPPQILNTTPVDIPSPYLQGQNPPKTYLRDQFDRIICDVHEENFVFPCMYPTQNRREFFCLLFSGQERFTVSLITTVLSKGCSIPRRETFPRGNHNYFLKGLNLRYIYCSQKHFYEKIEIY